MLIADIETNGLLDTLTTIHCISILDTDSGDIVSFNDQGNAPPIADALALLAEPGIIVFHNGLDFDIPAIEKLYPQWTTKATLRDTLIMSRLIYPNLAERDYASKERVRALGKRIGSHSLEAWGIRLGEWKGDYAKVMKDRGLDPWEKWNEDMQAYCEQDVRVTVKLLADLRAQGFSKESIELEHDVARIIRKQEQRGFMFDMSGALKLEETLRIRHAELTQELSAAFPPWETSKTELFTPKRDNKAKGWKAGVAIKRVKVKQNVFNPASRDHIANRLTAKYGWKPAKFTDSGKPMVDESVLESLPYPEAKLLAEYLLVEKRIGQLCDGKQGWTRQVKADGRIHGRVNTNGAVTGRMTHSNPNVAQVPKAGYDKNGNELSPYGNACRALFIASPGLTLVGADASGLELRCLAHFMARWDHGEYAKVILEGDIHTVNQKAAGLPTRDNAKTFIYALLYGAGAAKIGSIVGKGAQAGAKLRQRFLENLPALGKLIAAIEHALEDRDYLLGLDGRKLYVRSAHSALNTLLQSAGAVVMKKALVLFDEAIQSDPRLRGSVHPVANIHDEVQTETPPDVAEEVGKLFVECIRRAGEHFKFRCQLDGSFAVGKSWAETH